MEENYEQRLNRLEKRIEQLENQVKSLTKKTDPEQINRDLGKMASLRGAGG